MLARRFARMRETPVRYAAMDPRVDRALSQWLRTQLAVTNLHREHAQNIHNTGSEAEPLHGLMQAMQGGDYGVLPMYHDRAADTGLLHEGSVGQLRQILAQLRNRGNRTPHDPLIQAYTQGGAADEAARHSSGYVMRNRLPEGDRMNHELLPLLQRQAQTGQQPWRNRQGDLLGLNEMPERSLLGRLGAVLGGGGLGYDAMSHLAGDYRSPLLPEHTQVFTGALGRRDPVVGPHVRQSAYEAMLGSLPHLLNLHAATLSNHGIPGAQGTHDIALEALQSQDRIRDYAGRGGNV